RTSTAAAPAMTQAAIMQLVANSITTALEAQAANMANDDNTNGSYQPFYFNGIEGAVGLIR
ncbi:hypothetical protein Tco_1188375, partial [Tanacetum coccineum]